MRMKESLSRLSTFEWLLARVTQAKNSFRCLLGASSGLCPPFRLLLADRGRFGTSGEGFLALLGASSLGWVVGSA